MEIICALIILISGYIFSSTCLYTKYKINRLESQRLYIHSVGWGFCIFILISVLLYHPSVVSAQHDLLRFLISWLEGNLSILQTKDKTYLPSLLLVSGASLISSRPLSMTLNLIFKIHQYGYRSGNAVLKYTDDQFDKIILQSVHSTLPFMIITTNNKVYIGRSSVSFDPSKSKESEIKIEPAYLGYLDDQDKDVILSIDYKDVESLLSLEERFISIPKDKIVAMSLFHVDIFNKLKISKLKNANDNAPNSSAEDLHTGALNISIINKKTDEGITYSGPPNIEIIVKENKNR